MSRLGRDAVGVVGLVAKLAALRQIAATLKGVAQSPTASAAKQGHAKNLSALLPEIEEDLRRLDHMLIDRAQR